MQELMYYTSPFGPLTVAADDQGIVGTWWDTDRYYGDILEANARQVSPQANAFLRQAQVWLTEYFAGKIPGELPPLHLVGTPFQREVWQVLLTIPYGQTMTYGMIDRSCFGAKTKENNVSTGCGNGSGAEPCELIRTLSPGYRAKDRYQTLFICSWTG